MTQPADISLAPPLDDLATVAPPPVTTEVAQRQAAARAELAPERAAALDAAAHGAVSAFTSLDPHSEAFRKQAEMVASMGAKESAQVASASNRFAEMPIRAIDPKGPGAKIGRGLISLRQHVDSLSPAKQGDLLSPRRFLGLIPFGSRLDAFLKSFESAKTTIDAIVADMRDARDELLRSIADMNHQQQMLWSLMERMREYVYLGTRMDAEIEDYARTLEASDPARAKMIREEVLFPVRQRVQDLQTQGVIAVQGYLALSLTIANNKELAKGVNRTTETMILALNIGITLAVALAQQKQVAAMVDVAQRATGDLIEGNAALLQQNSDATARISSSPVVAVEQLQRAMDMTYAAIDKMSTYRASALAGTQTTVQSLEAIAEKGRSYAANQRAVGAAAQTIALPGDVA